MDEEIWKAVVGYEGYYEVSSHGRVRSLDRMRRGVSGHQQRCPGRVLKLADKGSGYLIVSLCTGLANSAKTHSVHRLVAQHFLTPSNKPHVNHLDSNRANNHYKNLEWVTQKENSVHACLFGGLSPVRNPNLGVKLTLSQVLEIRSLYHVKGARQIDIADMFNVSQTTVSSVVLNRIWKPIAQILPTEC